MASPWNQDCANVVSVHFRFVLCRAAVHRYWQSSRATRPTGIRCVSARCLSQMNRATLSWAFAHRGKWGQLTPMENG